MSDYSATADKKRGKRLDQALEKTFPNMSWRARSELLDLPNSTVVGWRNGREISCEGLSRLYEVGCDIVWILTGQSDAEHKQVHSFRFMTEEEGRKENPEEFEHRDRMEMERRMNSPDQKPGEEVTTSRARDELIVKYVATLREFADLGPALLSQRYDFEYAKKLLETAEEIAGTLRAQLPEQDTNQQVG